MFVLDYRLPKVSESGHGIAGNFAFSEIRTADGLMRDEKKMDIGLESYDDIRIRRRWDILSEQNMTQMQCSVINPLLTRPSVTTDLLLRA